MLKARQTARTGSSGSHGFLRKVETAMKRLFMVGAHIGCLLKMIWITVVLLHRILGCVELHGDWSCEARQ